MAEYISDFRILPELDPYAPDERLRERAMAIENGKPNDTDSWKWALHVRDLDATEIPPASIPQG